MDTGSAPAEVVDVGNYRASRLNALKHGVLSRHTVLPWEDEAASCCSRHSITGLQAAIVAACGIRLGVRDLRQLPPMHGAVGHA
jgi:hypothetical protein